MGWLQKILSDSRVQRKYINAGSVFGDAVSYSFLGEAEGFHYMLKKWASWEQEYARRGYRTISLDDFIGAGGYGTDISHCVGIKRAADEQPILHAEIFNKIYRPQDYPVDNLQKILDGTITNGTYKLPSTRQ